SEERVLHVAERDDPRQRARRAHDALDALERSAPVFELAALRVHEARSERPREARSAVRRRGASEAEQDLIDAPRRHGGDELSEPAARGAERVARALGDEREPDGARALYDPDPLRAGEERRLRLDDDTERTTDGRAEELDSLPGHPRGLDEHVERALAAVGHRLRDDLDARAREAARERRRRLD